MSSSENFAIAALLLACAKKKKDRKTKKKKRIWMKEWHKNRVVFAHENFIKELKLNSPNDFRNFIIMDSKVYDELLRMVAPIIIKKDTMMRDAIPADQRLSITLQFLASGDSYENLKTSSAIAACSIGKIVIETCEAIIKCLKGYIKCPKSTEDWKKIADGFYRQWNFPHCLGAVDCIHVAIKKPPNTGSLYFNRKQFFSVLLMAVVDSNYEFIVADVGFNGRVADGKVLRTGSFGQALDNDSLNLPYPEPSPCSERILPYVFLGDSAYQLTENFMKPFSINGLTHEQRIFNYRLNRARRVVENTFSIISSRFGVFQKAISLTPKKVETVLLTCCYLHNFLMRKTKQNYVTQKPLGKNDIKSDWNDTDTWKEVFVPKQLQATSSRNSANNPKIVREHFLEFFNNEGVAF